MIDKTAEKEAKALLEEYRTIYIGTLDYKEILPGVQQDRLAAIRRELERMGLMLEISSRNSALPEEIEIMAKEPPKKMTPQEAKDYDAWFCYVNDLPLP